MSQTPSLIPGVFNIRQPSVPRRIIRTPRQNVTAVTEFARGVNDLVGIARDTVVSIQTQEDKAAQRDAILEVSRFANDKQIELLRAGNSQDAARIADRDIAEFKKNLDKSLEPVIRNSISGQVESRLNRLKLIAVEKVRFLQRDESSGGFIRAIDELQRSARIGVDPEGIAESSAGLVEMIRADDALTNVQKERLVASINEATSSSLRASAANAAGLSFRESRVEFELAANDTDAAQVRVDFEGDVDENNFLSPQEKTKLKEGFARQSFAARLSKIVSDNSSNNPNDPSGESVALAWLNETSLKEGLDPSFVRGQEDALRQVVRREVGSLVEEQAARESGLLGERIGGLSISDALEESQPLQILSDIEASSVSESQKARLRAALSDRRSLAFEARAEQDIGRGEFGPSDLKALSDEGLISMGAEIRLARKIASAKSEAQDAALEVSSYMLAGLGGFKPDIKDQERYDRYFNNIAGQDVRQALLVPESVAGLSPPTPEDLRSVRVAARNVASVGLRHGNEIPQVIKSVISGSLTNPDSDINVFVRRVEAYRGFEETIGKSSAVEMFGRQASEIASQFSSASRFDNPQIARESAFERVSPTDPRSAAAANRVFEENSRAIERIANEEIRLRFEIDEDLDNVGEGLDPQTRNFLSEIRPEIDAEIRRNLTDGQTVTMAVRLAHDRVFQGWSQEPTFGGGYSPGTTARLNPGVAKNPFVAEMSFSHAIATLSARPGTLAAMFPDAIVDAEQKDVFTSVAEIARTFFPNSLLLSEEFDRARIESNQSRARSVATGRGSDIGPELLQSLFESAFSEDEIFRTMEIKKYLESIEFKVSPIRGRDSVSGETVWGATYRRKDDSIAHVMLPDGINQWRYAFDRRTDPDGKMRFNDAMPEALQRAAESQIELRERSLLGRVLDTPAGQAIADLPGSGGALEAAGGIVR